MTARPKDIGTQCESAVVKYLRVNGWPHAERRALRGVLDAGDITGTPGVAWSVKGGKAAETAGDGQLRIWMDELEVIRTNASADVGVLVCKRKGAGLASVGRWPAWVRLSQLFPGASSRVPIRLHLADLVDTLRNHGYGDAA